MGCCKKLLLLVLVVTTLTIGYIYQKLSHVPDLPKLELEKWWGTGSAKKIDTSIRPFKVQFTEQTVMDLKTRLSKSPSFAPLEGTGFEYGFNNDYLQEVIKFWANDYNFKERETFLNQYPQFVTNIQGLDIHYIHVKPTVARNVKVVPLLLMHSWPGSVREFYEMIPMLTTLRKEHDFVFEVIVPSLPGCGFSQATAKPGFRSVQMAIVMRNLMQHLGHKKYYIHGEHMGALVAMNIANFFPEEVLTIHVKLALVITPLAFLYTIVGTMFPSLIVEEKYQDRMYPLLDKLTFFIEESGYEHMQATKPDTIGIALRDSPSGLAAYILEKFSTWTNKDFRKLPDGGLTKKFKMVDLLDSIMIYWVSESITNSMRFYVEYFRESNLAQDIYKIPVTAPVAIANFKHENIYQSEVIQKLKFKNLIHFSHYEDGGRFAALELPQVLSDDIWTAMSKSRQVGKATDDEKMEL